jgi:hypothetical protein
MAMGDTDQTRGLSKAYIRRAVEASLRRLKTDVIDLYQAHTDDAKTPLEETLAAFAELIQEGKVRALGASNYSAPRLGEALAVSADARPAALRDAAAALQPDGAACVRGELEAVCVDNSLGVINYYALASGFLTGKYRSSADLGKSVRSGGAKKYLDDRGRRCSARSTWSPARRRRHRDRWRWPGRSPGRASPRRSPAPARRRSSTSSSERPTASRHAVDRADRSRHPVERYDGHWRAPAKALSMTQVLLCGAAIVTLSMGIRHGFGLWLTPVTVDRGWSREPSPSPSRCRTWRGASPGR